MIYMPRLRDFLRPIDRSIAVVAIKGQQIDRFLAQPDKAIILLYGADNGLVSERADDLVAKFQGDDRSGFAVTRLDGDAIANDPARLADELGGAGLFSTKTIVRLRAGSRNITKQVEAIANNKPEDAWLVIEADDLKPSNALRKVAEKHVNIASIPAYADTNQSLNYLIDQEIRGAGKDIDRDARQLLLALLGADRRLSRNEIKKLILYVGNNARITLDDALAVVADAASSQFDALADSIGMGDINAVERDIQQAFADDRQPPAIIISMARHFRRLADARLDIDHGATAEAAMRRLRPPVFFKRETAFRQQLNQWSFADLRHAMGRIGEREFAIRQNTILAPSLLRALALELALRAKRRQHSSRR